MRFNHSTIYTSHGLLDVYWTDEEFIVTWRDEPSDLPTEVELPSRELRQERVRKVLGDYVFNPYDRNPTEAEIESLEADGITKDSFEDG
jgi:hypothetical protein